jgi:hypothetical protein
MNLIIKRSKVRMMASLLVFLVLYIEFSVNGFGIGPSSSTFVSSLREFRARTPEASPSKLRAASWTDISTTLVSVQADYAAEIENAVGEEIYGPIFKAGLFIFVSGLVSAGVVAFIVSNRDSWSELDQEIGRGKEAQLIDVVTAQQFEQASTVSLPETQTTNSGADADGVDDLDL